MKPLRLVETDPGEHSLLLDAGDTAVDDTIEALGYEPNGYFWEGVATLLLERFPAVGLADRIGFDPEAGMFCAISTDRGALEKLGSLMASVANEPERLRAVVEEGRARGFEFDD